MTGIIKELAAGLDEAWRWVAIYDEQARAAIARHPDAGDLFAHAAPIMTRPWWFEARGFGAEFIYRGYVAELCERLAAGADTRPGTAAEVAMACSMLGDAVKPPPVVLGLYHRMWMQAFPDHPASAEIVGPVLSHYEWAEGGSIDALEREMRRRMRQPARKLPDLTCDGWHGDCRFSTTLF